MSHRTLIHETANAPGTNVTFNLAGAVNSSRRSFAQGFSSGAPTFYVMTDGVQSEWGMGTFTAASPSQLSRTTVWGNSVNTTARLNFTGAVDVYCALPAEVSHFLGGLWVGTFGGTAQALTGTVPMPLRARQADTRIKGLVNLTNTATDPTATINGLTAGTIKDALGNQIWPGQLRIGRVAELLDDGTNYRLLNPALAVVNASGSRTIPTGASTAVNWTAPSRDDLDSWASGNASRFTMKVAGRIRIDACVSWGSTGSPSNRVVQIYKNNAYTNWGVGGSFNGGFGQIVGAELDVAANDYLEIMCTQDSGSGLGVTAVATLRPVHS